MKRIIIYISIIMMITIITAGATFAYLTASINSTSNSISTEGAELKVAYTGGTKIEGYLSMSENKSGGLNTTVNIRLEEDSVKAKSNLYININQITSDLASAGFKWEVYKIINGEENFVNSGNFLGCQNGNTTKKCSNGDKLYIVNDYITTTTNTSFKVYVWLDGNMSGNEVLGDTFAGTIAAESEKYTGKLE